MRRTELSLPGAEDFYTQEAFKALRTNLQFCGQDVRAVAITSCNENEGKTTVTLQLGKSLADLGKRVLVIDADMRKSVMAGRNTTATQAVGLSEYLTGMADLGDCVHKTQHPTLHIIFSGQYPPNPVELLSGRHFNALLKEARRSYDYVLVDTPPLGSVIDAATIAPISDGVMLVLGDRVRARQAQEVVAQLERSGSRILGVVRNSTSKKNGKRGKAYYKAYK